MTQFHVKNISVGTFSTALICCRARPVFTSFMFFVCFVLAIRAESFGRDYWSIWDQVLGREADGTGGGTGKRNQEVGHR